MSHSRFTLPNWNHEDSFETGSKTLTCTAEGWNGNAISGHLVDFSPEHKLLKIQPFGDQRALGLKFTQLKRLQVDIQPDTDTDFMPTSMLGQQDDSLESFVVYLRDGALFSGIAHTHRKLPYGLWLFPKKTLDTDPFRIFIPKSGITRFEHKGVGDAMISDTDFNETVIADVDLLSLEAAVGTSPKMVETHVQLQEALDKQAKLKPVPIGEALLGLGKITAVQLTEALRHQKEKPRAPLGQLLVDMGLVSPSDLQTAFARKMGYPFVDLNKFPIDTRALRQVPIAVAVRLKVLPLMQQGATIVVAMQDPLQFKIIEELEFTTQRKVVPVVSTSVELSAKIAKAYRDIGMADAPRPVVQDSRADLGADPLQDAFQLAVELSDELKDQFEDEKPLEQSDNTLVKLINSMISEAYQQRASDIHIEPYPGREKLTIRFRIDGEMKPYLELPSSYRNALIARIKIMCDLDISERRKPQDGKINFAKFGGLPIELRVATIPTANGLEDVVMRILTSFKPLPLQDLGLSAANQAAIEQLLARPHGLFLCVGPTGSGKTTTLHSALQRVNVPNRKIWTAEDPVEITQRGLRQIQVNPKIGWTFAAALRALLRADPDVIMVGEIRDHETAEMAIEASLTGHLVFSTLHTNSAAETIVRLIDLGVDPFAFADSLQGVLAQRLVRRWCPNCRTSRPLSDHRLQELLEDYQSHLPADHPEREVDTLLAHWRRQHATDGQLLDYEAAGCDTCSGTGYRSRLALHELLMATPEVRYLTQHRGRPQDIQTTAIQQGMRTLRQDGIAKVLQGWTSLAEVRSSTS